MKRMNAVKLAAAMTAIALLGAPASAIEMQQSPTIGQVQGMFQGGKDNLGGGYDGAAARKGTTHDPVQANPAEQPPKELDGKPVEATPKADNAGRSGGATPKKTPSLTNQKASAPPAPTIRGDLKKGLGAVKTGAAKVGGFLKKAAPVIAGMAAGAGIGFFFGGPIGAAIGAAAGLVAGLFAKRYVRV